MAFSAIAKCPFCGGQAKLEKRAMSLFEGALKIDGTLAYKCEKCGEEFVTGKMLDSNLKLAKKQFHFNRNLISTGGSIGVTFPTDLTTYYKLEKGEQVKIIPKSRKEISILLG